jgi:hypothetical protein
MWRAPSSRRPRAISPSLAPPSFHFPVVSAWETFYRVFGKRGILVQGRKRIGEEPPPVRLLPNVLPPFPTAPRRLSRPRPAPAPPPDQPARPAPPTSRGGVRASRMPAVSPEQVPVISRVCLAAVSSTGPRGGRNYNSFRNRDGGPLQPSRQDGTRASQGARKESGRSRPRRQLLPDVPSHPPLPPKASLPPYCLSPTPPRPTRPSCPTPPRPPHRPAPPHPTPTDPPVLLR